MKTSRHYHPPLVLITVLLVALMAVLAGSSLWLLRRMHRESAHQTAARSVVELGRQMTAHLAGQEALRASPETPEAWSRFAELVRSLSTVEKGLQYVSVSRGGVIVFHQQRDVLDEETRAEETQQRRAAAEVQIGRRLLEMGALKVPVVVFAADVAGADGTVQRVELGLRRETVALEEKAATDAIASMFRVSLVTVSVAFLASAILVAWMMHREAVRERRQREQEHLAFAGMLANGVVHDFRNPMSSLRLDLQMLGRALGTEGRAERVRELVARMGGTVDRMDKVFREFQYVSRPDREEQPHAVALRPCLNNCLSALAARFERKKLRVELRVADDVDGVRAYESALNRALVNVLTNAEQFSPEGATVEVDAAVHGHRVVVRIMDRGPGIPPADENRIFDMFVSSRPGGTGLGLFLARTALERAGGGITVKNRPEGGAEFRLELPAAAAAVSAPGEERQEA